MAYTPPSGGSVGLSLADGYAPPSGQSLNLEFDSSYLLGRLHAAGGFGASAFGAPTLGLKSRPLQVQGSNTALVPRPTVALDIPHIRPLGIDNTIVAGTPEYVRWRRFLSPAAIDPPPSFYSVERIRLPGGYNPPPGGSMVVNWFVDPYAPPPGSSVLLEFGAVGYGYVWPAMGDQALFGLASVAQPTGIRPGGIAPGSFGLPTVQSTLNNLRVTGFDSQAFGTAVLSKSASALLPTGIAASGYGAARVYNLRQYLNPTGINALVSGTAYVSGGVKNVTLVGINSLVFGSALVVNTKASQTAAPTGIPILTFAGPSVSPRMLYPSGIAAPGLGAAFVQRNPTPSGWDSELLGQPSIEYKTKYLAPTGVLVLDLGYPVVYDPTQKVYPSSPVEVGLFGDARIANKSAVVRVGGFDALELSAWALVENTRRYVVQGGWDSLTFGASRIANKTPSLTPQGFDALGRSSTTETGVGFATRYLHPSGINLLGLGSPTLTKTPEIAPAGISGAIGTPTVWPRIRTLEINGQDSQVFGAPTVWFRYRYLPAPGFAADSYGTAKVEHFRRTLLASGAQHSAYGTLTIGNADRTLAPVGISATFASAHMVGGTRYLGPAGFEATAWGARIIPEVQSVYPLGFSGLYGQASIRNNTQLVAPPGFLTAGQQAADRWGTPVVWNLRQYVVMSYDPDSGLNPPAWPQWTLIENRNHTMRASGLDLSVIGLPQIDNKARPLLPVGITVPATGPFYQAGLVAYRVRPFQLEGIEPPYISTWATVYNDAAVLAPQGFNAAHFGQASLGNTRRYFNNIGGFDATWFGYPMVADRIRTLEFDSRYSIAPPQIALPEVKLHTRYVEPRGTDMSSLGGAFLDIHWTIITPRWTLQNLYGSPTVRNVTPELHQQGRNVEEFGDAFARLQWRPVKPEGTLMQWFGQAGIAYRNRTLFVSGLRAGAFGDKLTVVRTGAPSYSTQFISLEPESIAGNTQDEGYGIPPPGTTQNPQVGRPIINQQVIYVHQKDPMTLFGGHKITANTIRVEPGYWELLVGEPMVGAKIRTVTVGAYAYEDRDYQGNPLMSPLTIWAVMEAPAQAKTNHGNGSGLPDHYVDGYYKAPGTVFGNANVTNQFRAIQVYGWGDGSDSYSNGAGYGRPTLSLRRQYVTPTGFTSFRSGWHMLPGDQAVQQFDGADSQVFGTPKVAPPPYIGPQTIKPQGLGSLSMGLLYIDFYNRFLKPSGYVATLMGTFKPGDTPYMWQGLRVGPLMPSTPVGFDAQGVGEPWASFRVRELKLEGFDAFRCEYQLEAFDKRMRVTRAPVVRPSRNIAPLGIYAFASTASNVRPGTHFIRPDGNSDQFRKGAF